MNFLSLAIVLSFLPNLFAHDYLPCSTSSLPPASYNSSAYIHNNGNNVINLWICNATSPSPSTCTGTNLISCSLSLPANTSNYIIVTANTVTSLVFQFNSINPFHWHPIDSAPLQFASWPPPKVDFDINVTYPDGDGATDILCDTNEDCPSGVTCITSPAPPRCKSVTPSPSASPAPPAPIPSPSALPPAISCNLNGTWEQPHAAAYKQHSGDAFITIIAQHSDAYVTSYLFSCESKNSLCPNSKSVLNGTMVASNSNTSLTLIPNDGSGNINGFINSTLNCNTITVVPSTSPTVVWNNINPPPVPNLNLNVTAATFLGKANQQFVTTGISVLGSAGSSSLLVSSSRTGIRGKTLSATSSIIAVVGNGQVQYSGITPKFILNGTSTSNGTIILLSTDVTLKPGSGVTVIGMIKVGDRIDHIRTNNNGDSVIAGSFGVAVLQNLISLSPSLVWYDSLLDIYPGSCGVCCTIGGGNCKVDIGDDGVVAIDLAVTASNEGGGDLWAAYTKDGVRFLQDSRPAASLDTVAVNSKLNQVYVGWFYNSNTGKEPMVMPRVEVYKYSSSSSKPTLPTVTLDYVDFPWNAEVYRQNGQPCNGDVADGRVMGIRIGNDGTLLFMGRSDGGDSPYQCGMRNSSRITPIVSIDGFTSTYNMQAQAVTNMLRVDASTGETIVGQLQVTRLSNTRGNTLVTLAAQSDSNSNVYLLQAAACCIAYMGNLTINNQLLSGPGDATVLHIVTPNFEQRLHWTHFVQYNGTMGGGGPVDIDIKNNVVAIALTSNGDLITSGNIPDTQSNVGGDPVGYIVVLPTV